MAETMVWGGGVLELLRELRGMGATRATFFESGSLEQVEFVAPIAIAVDGDTDPAPAPGADFQTPKAFRELMKAGAL